jgi:8-oxo-dGTP pyrophosphatase MutT (NUDIX family)
MHYALAGRGQNEATSCRSIPLLKRLIMTSVHQALRLYWFFRRPTTAGTRAIALTPEGKVILIRHSYIPGWHLPGGGKGRHEEASAAVLRELREEIGLISHDGLATMAEYEHVIDFKHDRVSLFVVRNVAYAPHPTLEIVDVGEFELDDLPTDASLPTVRRLAEFQGKAAVQDGW